MTFDVDIYKLSNDFFSDHPADRYPEIMRKTDRPYYCLLIDIHTDYFICVPFRSNINHANAYMFKKSERSRRTHSGLDYTKIVIISKSSYFDDSAAIVDSDEYKEAMKNIRRIVHSTLKYVNGYIDHSNGTKVLDKSAYDRKYKYSTLPYFHNILGIKDIETAAAE